MEEKNKFLSFLSDSILSILKIILQLSFYYFFPMDSPVEYLMRFYSNGHKIYNLQIIRNAFSFL